MSAEPAIRLVDNVTEQHEKKTSSRRHRGVTNRNGVWYFQATIRGRRWSESLQTGDLKVAIARAKLKRQAIETERWDALDASRARSQVSNIGAVCDAYLEIVRRHGTVRPRTATANVAALLRIVATRHADPRSASATELTGDLAAGYGAARLAEGDTAGTRRSIASNIRQARSVVRPALVEDYRRSGIRFPESIASFRAQFVMKAPKQRYEMPPESLYAPTIAAGRQERGTIGMIFALAYDLGLRAGEIAAVQWGWFEEDVTPAGPRMWLAIRERADWRPKGTSGRVPVFPGVWKRLEPFRGSSDEYLIPGPTRNAREDLVKREFATWMRARGWESRMCAHELRKLRGSWWFARYGVERTYKWLRHANIQTTLDHYADLPGRPEPDWSEAPNAAWTDQIRA